MTCIEGCAGRARLAGGEDAREGASEALAQRDQVVHRHLAAAVERRGPFAVLAGEVRLIGRDAERDPLGEQRGVAQQLAQAGIVVARLDLRVGIHRDGAVPGRRVAIWLARMRAAASGNPAVGSGGGRPRLG